MQTKLLIINKHKDKFVIKNYWRKRVIESRIKIKYRVLKKLKLATSKWIIIFKKTIIEFDKFKKMGRRSIHITKAIIKARRNLI